MHGTHIPAWLPWSLIPSLIRSLIRSLVVLWFLGHYTSKRAPKSSVFLSSQTLQDSTSSLLYTLIHSVPDSSFSESQVRAPVECQGQTV